MAFLTWPIMNSHLGPIFGIWSLGCTSLYVVSNIGKSDVNWLKENAASKADMISAAWLIVCMFCSWFVDQVVPYPPRPVDFSTDFDGTTAPPPSQMPNTSSLSGSSSQMHQSMNMGIQQQRVLNQGMGGNLGVNQQMPMHGLNTGSNMFVQRGNPTGLQQQQAQQQPVQQQNMRRKDQTNPPYPHYQPSNKSRRMWFSTNPYFNYKFVQQRLEQSVEVRAVAYDLCD